MASGWTWLVGGVGGVSVTVLGLMAAVAWGEGRYEAPVYRVVETHPGFEVRAYAPRLQAEVTVRGSQRDSANAAFGILAGYIFGRNQPQETIGMTIPVGQQPIQAAHGGGASVAPGGAPEAWVVWFMMPSRYTLDTLPPPQDPRIRLREEAAHQAAVLSFRGWVRRETFAERAAELLTAVAAAGLTPVGAPTLAQYSDPRVPGPLRYNEVQVRLAE